MRLSKLFGNTLREVPAEAQMISHQLLLRAGMIRQVATGIYAYLPLGWRVLHKIGAILREEMDAIGGQEMRMPSVQPAELWQKTGRYHEAGPVLARFLDRNQRELVLGITHEEVVTYLARGEIHSYRQLPFMVYQIQTKFRDEPRSRGGLIRAREFSMKDGYSFHADYADLDTFYQQVFGAYLKVFERCGVDVLAVEADPGVMGGVGSHEFMALNDDGEDILILCDGCGYSANAEGAVAGSQPGIREAELPLLKVATPGTTTIEEVAHYLQVPPRQTLKAIFYVAAGELVFVVIRGDLEVNETRLARLLNVEELRLAEWQEVERAGIRAGYASPVGWGGQARIVADMSVKSGSNFVAGANEEGYHLCNVNYPRDFRIDTIAEFAAVRAGDPCAHCGAPLEASRGIELGHIFKLGTKYSERMGATFLDSEGRTQTPVMGCYGLGLGRLMSAVAEQCHDERGLIWPPSVAPYQVHLVSLGRPSEIVKVAETVYDGLARSRLEVLYDDREESPGVKFNDADLIGVPLRVTVGSRSLSAGGVEVKRRSLPEAEIVPIDTLSAKVCELLEGSG